MSGDVIDIFPIDQVAKSLGRIAELCTLCSRPSDESLAACDACKLAKFCRSCRGGKHFERYRRCHNLVCAPDKRGVVVRFLEVSPADFNEAHGVNKESAERLVWDCLRR